MSSQKKLRKKLGKKVLSGKLTVTEARARLGRDLARKSGLAPVVKAAGAQGRAAADAEWLAEQRHLTAEAMREAAAAIKSAGPVTYQDVLNAAKPMSRPAVTKAAAPVPREDPRQVLKALKAWQSPLDVPAAPARAWTPAELSTLREADRMADPESRERIRSGLIARRDGGVA